MIFKGIYQEISNSPSSDLVWIIIAMRRTIYTWGNSQFGKLGIGECGIGKCEWLPREIILPYNETGNLTLVAAGRWHSIAVSG